MGGRPLAAARSLMLRAGIDGQGGQRATGHQRRVAGVRRFVEGEALDAPRLLQPGADAEEVAEVSGFTKRGNRLIASEITKTVKVTRNYCVAVFFYALFLPLYPETEREKGPSCKVRSLK